LFTQFLKVVVDILLELADRLGREGMRYGLALACVLCAVACVEEAAADGNEGVVVLSVAMLIFPNPGHCSFGKGRRDRPNVRLQETIAMAIYLRNSLRICNADMVRLYPHQGTVFLMRGIDSEISSPSSTMVEQPEVCEGCRERCRDAADGPIAEVGEKVVQDRKEHECIRRYECREKHDR
jgi:hypothetical protein